MMPRLILMHTRRIEIPRLDPQRRLQELTQEIITKAVREALRKQYGPDKVKVSRSAVLDRGRIWTGKCRIDGLEYSYLLMEGLTE